MQQSLSTQKPIIDVQNLQFFNLVSLQSTTTRIQQKHNCRSNLQYPTKLKSTKRLPHPFLSYLLETF
jgi:hypothetical protein